MHSPPQMTLNEIETNKEYMALKDIAISLTTTKNELHYRHISMQMDGMDE